MPVTKTAKRALRVSLAKKDVNTSIKTNLEKAIRAAKKAKTFETIQKVSSLADRAVKKDVIHKNKASRIKAAMAKIAKPSTTKAASSKTTKKSSKK